MLIIQLNAKHRSGQDVYNPPFDLYVLFHSVPFISLPQNCNYSPTAPTLRVSSLKTAPPTSNNFFKREVGGV